MAVYGYDKFFSPWISLSSESDWENDAELQRYLFNEQDGAPHQ